MTPSWRRALRAGVIGRLVVRRTRSDRIESDTPERERRDLRLVARGACRRRGISGRGNG